MAMQRQLRSNLFALFDTPPSDGRKVEAGEKEEGREGERG